MVILYIFLRKGINFKVFDPQSLKMQLYHFKIALLSIENNVQL